MSHILISSNGFCTIDIFRISNWPLNWGLSDVINLVDKIWFSADMDTDSYSICLNPHYSILVVPLQIEKLYLLDLLTLGGWSYIDLPISVHLSLDNPFSQNLFIMNHWICRGFPLTNQISQQQARQRSSPKRFRLVFQKNWRSPIFQENY